MMPGSGLPAWRLREVARRVSVLEAARDGGKPDADADAGKDKGKDKEKDKPKDWWDRAQALMPIVNGVVLALAAWWISGAVEYAVKRETLQLAQAKEMQALIAGLAGDNVDTAAATSAALTLAAYGPPAVGPLLALLSERYDEVRGPAAESALRAVGIVQREALCDPLLTLLRSRSSRFGWPTRATLIRLLGDVQCTRARATLELLRRRYAAATPAELARDFAALPTFDAIAVAELRRALDDSLRSLEPLR